MRRQRILVDSDGVMSNFVQAVIDLANSVFGKFTYEQATQWDLYTALGLSEEAGKELDAQVRLKGFCLSLAPIPGAREGLDELRKYADVYCLTAPFSEAPYWMYERELWLKKHMGFSDKQIIPAKCKFMVAGDYLTDDKIDNLKEWEKEPHAGLPILFDQPWNKKESGFMRAKGWKDLVKMMKTLIGVP